jgi:HTH-type transcriptional regulator/antitoxin HipB
MAEPGVRAGYEYARRRHEIGEVIRRIRKERGLTQTKLAQLADLTQATISRIEAGGVDPELDTLDRLSEVLGVELVIEFRDLATT